MIEIKNITKTYKPKKGAPVQALKSINLTIEDKGMVFILGKSGSGKSTLLHILGGLDNYDSGELVIKGKSSSTFKTKDYDAYRNTLVGFIFQDYNILDEFSVGKNILLALELQGQKSNKAEVERSLKEVDLEGYYNRKPNELSGGQKQRVAIARALIKSPEIIMADEPTGALDSKTGIQVFDTLKKLSENKLVVIVSHDREFAELYADRIIELADGNVISDVQKYKTEPSVPTAGVNIIDNKAVIIKQGHVVTLTEFNLISKVLNLAAKDSDAIIPITKKANDDVKKTLKIDDAGAATHFDKTNESTLPIKNYGANDLTLKKSRLPYKDSFKMGASALKYKKFRLFLTILLSSIAFAIFGFVDTLGAYNFVKVTYDSMIESNINYISINKEVGEDSYYSKTYFTEQDVTNLEEKYSSHSFTKINSHQHDSYWNTYRYYESMGNLNNVGPYYSDQSANGFTTTTKSELDKYGYKIIGMLPTNVETGTLEEIAITTYQYEIFKKADHVYYDEETYQKVTTPITSETDLIGKIIRFSYNTSIPNTNEYESKSKNFKIVGIINTKLDSSRYEKLKQTVENYDISISMLMGEFDTLTKNSLHNSVFVSSNSEFYTAQRHYATTLVSPLTNKNSDTSLISHLYGKKTTTENYSIQNAATYLLNQFDSMLQNMSKILLYFGIGFAVFASLLLFNFITTSISYKKREIGILRAVGAKSSDVFGVFFNESLIIAIINWLIATGLAWGTCLFLNSYLRSQGLLISLISFGVRQIALILAVAILAAFISTFLPVRGIARKKPIDAIKNR